MHTPNSRNKLWWLCGLLGLGFIALSFPAGCGTSSPVEVKYQQKTVEVIDMHLHPGEWDKIPMTTREFLASRFPFPFGLLPKSLASAVLTGEGILSEMNKAGAKIGVLFAVYAPKTVGICTNEYVISQLKADPKRLLGLASLRVDRWRKDEQSELARLRKALQEPGMIGIKLAHAHMHFRMDDPRYYGIYRIASDLNKPIYLHIGSSPFPGISRKEPYTNPAYLEDAIKKFPKATFILGHLGYDFVNKTPGFLDICLRLARTYKNVYLEPSALGSAGSDPTGEILTSTMKKIRDQKLVDRVIYGSDGPQSPGFVRDYLERTIRAMEKAGYTYDEAAAVLGKNFRRVFRIDAK